jgi:para-aminobenzoate synthetase
MTNMDWVPQTTLFRHNLRLLFIDHYDSFTYNLVDIFAQICQRAPLTVAADSATSWKDLMAMTTAGTAAASESVAFDGIVLGPGPGCPSDYPLSLDIIRNANVPILGVCLGHQMLGQMHGAKVTLAPTEIHGQVWTVHLDASTSSLFDGLPSTIPATRYHSLQVTWDRNDASVQLVETASSSDGVCMALQHSTLPQFGVQFHPESIGTEPHGRLVLENFCRICQNHQESILNDTSLLTRTIDPYDVVLPSDGSAYFFRDSLNEGLSPLLCHRNNEKAGTVHDELEVLIHKVRFPLTSRPNPEGVMQSLLSQEPFSFWLDSSNHQQSPNANNRVSILGTTSASETGGRRIEYYGEDFPLRERGVFVYANVPIDDEIGTVERHDTDILTYLGAQIPQNSTTITEIDEIGNEPVERVASQDSPLSLPFSFRGGFVGYLGYETRYDTARFLEEAELGLKQQQAPSRSCSKSSDSGQRSRRIPTAAFLWADRSFVYDHVSQDWYLVAVCSRITAEQRAAALSWMKSSALRILNLGSLQERTPPIPGTKHTVPVAFVPNRSRETYNRNFDRCLELIRQGESYELCLTNHLEATIGSAASLSPLLLYQILRRRNPAPFAAFLNWNSKRESSAGVDAGARSGSLAIACSSPERFLSVLPSAALVSGALEVEAKPIKGTCARVQPANGRSRTLDEAEEDSRRAQELQSSVKNRAENLMIVDLLRNDLSRVCEPGSVRVAKLMDIESFATVHQMVSTIRGILDPSRASSIDVLKACFPGGSMTGAPKKRTMDLLDDLEEGVSRGPYSGCLGYISLDGSMDMNIVIRSAVLTRENDDDAWHVSIGAGGAITALSESNDEYGEMMLKASAVMSAVSEWANSVELEDRAVRRLRMNTTSLFTATQNLTNAFSR